MSYDVLSDELYDNSKSRKLKKHRKNRKIKPIYIHIFLIILVIIVITFLLMNEFKPVKNKMGVITIFGTSNFNISYLGNLSLNTKNFIFKTDKLNFNQTQGNFNIINFSGRIFLNNKTKEFYIIGYGSKIKINGEAYLISKVNFVLISKKKTNIFLTLKSLNLNVINGNLKIDNKLDYNFKNATFQIKNFNMSLAYENQFTFYGQIKNLDMIADNGSLVLAYNSNTNLK